MRTPTPRKDELYGYAGRADTRRICISQRKDWKGARRPIEVYRHTHSGARARRVNQVESHVLAAGEHEWEDASHQHHRHTRPCQLCRRGSGFHAAGRCCSVGGRCCRRRTGADRAGYQARRARGSPHRSDRQQDGPSNLGAQAPAQRRILQAEACSGRGEHQDRGSAPWQRRKVPRQPRKGQRRVCEQHDGLVFHTAQFCKDVRRKLPFSRVRRPRLQQETVGRYLLQPAITKVHKKGHGRGCEEIVCELCDGAHLQALQPHTVGESRRPEEDTERSWHPTEAVTTTCKRKRLAQDGLRAVLRQHKRFRRHASRARTKPSRGRKAKAGSLLRWTAGLQDCREYAQGRCRRSSCCQHHQTLQHTGCIWLPLLWPCHVWYSTHRSDCPSTWRELLD